MVKGLEGSEGLWYKNTGNRPIILIFAKVTVRFQEKEALKYAKQFTLHKVTLLS